jgi:phage-related holin
MKIYAVNEGKEIMNSILSLNLKNEFLIMFTMGGFTLGSLSSFVVDWIYDPAVSFYALILLIIADHISGMSLAWKRDVFETRKSIRILWTLLSHTALLAFANSLSKGSDVLAWMNEGVFVPLVMVNLVSLIKNLSLLGLIKKDFAGIFYKKIDVYKNDTQKNAAPSGNRTPVDGC